MKTISCFFAMISTFPLKRDEFEKSVTDIYTILEPEGVFYINMKIGTGEEYRSVPGKNYPGGEKARRLLPGDRYNTCYTRDNLKGYFKDFICLFERDLQHAEEVIE